MNPFKKKFKCTSCGLCCSNVKFTLEAKHDSPEYQAEVDAFPHGYDEKGRCEKLGEDNTCTIYDNRPTLCNVDAMYDKYPNLAKSRKEWYKINNIGCNAMIKSAELDDSYLIKIK